MACDPRTPPLFLYTGRPPGESARRELSYSQEAGRANVSGTATRLPGVSGRVALWSRIILPSRSKWLHPLRPYDDFFGKAFEISQYVFYASAITSLIYDITNENIVNLSLKNSFGHGTNSFFILFHEDKLFLCYLIVIYSVNFRKTISSNDCSERFYFCKIFLTFVTKLFLFNLGTS